MEQKASRTLLPAFGRIRLATLLINGGTEKFPI